LSEAVRFENISKAYGAVKALQDVSLNIPGGSMHAIVGENGAGKTTLMRVLYGVTQADSGSLIVNGKQARFRSSAEATRSGVGMVSQHYGIIPELSCLQNLILGAEPGPLLKAGEMEDRAQELAAKMGFEFSWRQEASGLSPSGKQKLEILKLLWRNSKLMILDEPTAMLSPADADALFVSMAKLIASGATVLLVTHRVREVMQYCRRVAVMRLGKLVADLDVGETDNQALSRLIVGEGQAVSALTPKLTIYEGEPALSLSKVSVLGAKGNNALSSVTFEVRPGEIVGIAGLDGNGQQELLLTVAGIMKPSSGELRLLDGLDESSSTRTRLAQGLRLIPEDRHTEGIVEEWSLEENTALGLQFFPPEANGGLVDSSERRGLATQIVERFATRHGGLNKPMASLSGGNQQRLVVARSLAVSPRLLVAFQPVRGLDLGATARIYAAIVEACAKGMAALVISFDLDELIGHCDRILVLNHGRLEEPPPEKRLDRTAIGNLMVGVS
jgi:ABC-type uncharacterized transport system ATPase subunit